MLKFVIQDIITEHPYPTLDILKLNL